MRCPVDLEYLFHLQHGSTPLTIAAEDGLYEMTKLFIACGADLDAVDKVWLRRGSSFRFSLNTDEAE